MAIHPMKECYSMDRHLLMQSYKKDLMKDMLILVVCLVQVSGGKFYSIKSACYCFENYLYLKEKQKKVIYFFNVYQVYISLNIHPKVISTFMELEVVLDVHLTKIDHAMFAIDIYCCVA